MLTFRELAALLDAARPFYALQARGVDGAELPLLRVEDMAAAYIDEIRNVQSEGPYLLGGYSFGGLVAHAMAIQLRAQGEDVAALALLDSFSAKTVHSVLPQHWWQRHRDRVQALTIREVVPFLRERGASAFHLGRRKVGVALYRARLQSRAKRSLSMPTDLKTKIIGSANARRLYQLKTFDGSAVLFRTGGQHATADRAYADWPQLIAGGVETKFVPGDHNSMLAEPAVQELAQSLGAYLSAVDPAPLIAKR